MISAPPNYYYEPKWNFTSSLFVGFASFSFFLLLIYFFYLRFSLPLCFLHHINMAHLKNIMKCVVFEKISQMKQRKPWGFLWELFLSCSVIYFRYYNDLLLFFFLQFLFRYYYSSCCIYLPPLVYLP